MDRALYISMSGAKQNVLGQAAGIIVHGLPFCFSRRMAMKLMTHISQISAENE